MARILLKEKLAACINLLGPLESFFWWQKKIDRANEYLLLIKTQASHFKRLRSLIEKKHPYSIPETIALPIRQGNPAYLDWLRSSLKD